MEHPTPDPLEPPHPEPGDPMWRRFRELHPEVTLVLLPESAAPAGESDATEPTGEPVAAVDEATAHRIADAVVADVYQATDALSCWGAEPTLRWAPTGPDTLRPTAKAYLAPGRWGVGDGAELARRVADLGWTARLNPSDALVWVDAGRGEETLRLTVSTEALGVVVTGPAVRVAPELRTSLRTEAGRG